MYLYIYIYTRPQDIQARETYYERPTSALADRRGSPRAAPTSASIASSNLRKNIPSCSFSFSFSFSSHSAAAPPSWRGPPLSLLRAACIYINIIYTYIYMYTLYYVYVYIYEYITHTHTHSLTHSLTHSHTHTHTHTHTQTEACRVLLYAYVSIRQHTSAYVSTRRHTSAYVLLATRPQRYCRVAVSDLSLSLNVSLFTVSLYIYIRLDNII